MFDKVKVFLPESFYLVVGDTFQLFYRGVVDAPNPEVFSIISLCEVGKTFPRYFEYTPDKTGEHKLTLSVYGPGKKLLGHGETTLKVVEPNTPQKPTNILCVGASLSSGFGWLEELNRRLGTSEEEPKGLGFDDKFKFVGSCKKGDLGQEAYGGWRWDWYTEDKKLSVWVECDHDKTSEDQHSLWQDGNGNVWLLETIENGRLKFKSPNLIEMEKPDGGELVHFKNAINTDNIKIKASEYEGSNPFYNKETESVDFIHYTKKNNISSIDAAYIFLGANCYFDYDGKDPKDLCDKVIVRAKKLVSALKNAYPDVQVKVMGYPVPSVYGGMGSNYGAKMPFCDAYGYTRFVLLLNKAYEDWCKENDYMEFICISAQFDSEYNYPCTQKPVNARSTIMERFDTNGLHCTHSGYMQIADAAYRNIVANYCK